MQKQLQTEVSQLLEEAGTFARQGKREKAYRASLRATTIAPDEPLAWYLRSQNAPSREEQLMCLSHAYSPPRNNVSKASDSQRKAGWASPGFFFR